MLILSTHIIRKYYDRQRPGELMIYLAVPNAGTFLLGMRRYDASVEL